MLALLGGRHTAQHYLAVLAAIPEPAQPGVYSEMIPCVEEEGVEQPLKHDPREQDWCEGAWLSIGVDQGQCKTQLFSTKTSLT